MRYLLMVKSDENLHASGPPKELLDAIAELGVEATRTGKLVSVGGLYHSSRGASVRVRGGKLVVTDGPFSEAKEVIGGFSIFELGSLDEAKEEARKFMEVHRKHWPGWEGDCEIRPIFERNAP
jgi:hypothetical protein